MRKETVTKRLEKRKMLTEPRLTHVALPSSDLQRSIDFYTQVAPLVVVSRHEDEMGQAAWLSNDKQVEDPFVLVLVRLYADQDKGRQPILTPFAHIGIEVPNRKDVEDIAELGRERGWLHWEPRQMPDPVGYICALKDPDGNVVEFSHNQKVFETVRNLWGSEDAAALET
jgi:lactoylglutathione lyase